MKSKVFSILTLMIVVAAAFIVSCSKLDEPAKDLAACGTCNWYGTNYPVCCNITSGWGWENNASCIGAITCTESGQTCTGCTGNPTSFCGTGGGATVCLSAVAANGQVSLSWTVSGTITSQEIYKDTDSNPSGRIRVASVSASTRSYTVTGLTNGTTYYFWVKFFANGTGYSSGAASATPTGTSSSSSSSSGGIIIGNGVNLQPSYYNNGDVNLGLSLMNSYSKITTVRLEIEPQNGDGDGAPTIATIQRWIKEAKAANKIVICTYHNRQDNGSDNTSALTAAANWWKTNYAALATAGSFTVNVMNEWGSHNQTPSSFASAYNSAISTIRQVYSGNIIVDIPGWAQETQIAYEARNLLTDSKIIYSVHIYGSAYVQYGVNRPMTTADLDVLGNAGKPVIVGEFGSLQSGGADWSALVTYAKSKGWPLLGWAWNGDGGSMNMVTPTWNLNPSATSFSPDTYFNDVYNKL